MSALPKAAGTSARLPCSSGLLLGLWKKNTDWSCSPLSSNTSTVTPADRPPVLETLPVSQTGFDHICLRFYPALGWPKPAPPHKPACKCFFHPRSVCWKAWLLTSLTTTRKASARDLEDLLEVLPGLRQQRQIQVW